MDDNKLFNEISEEVSSMPIFDTHEHLLSEEERRTKPLDVFYLFSHYVGSDLISSGMPEAGFNSLFDQNIEIEKRWNLFYPYLENVKNTSYYRIVAESAKDLFQIEDINKNTYKELSEKM
jgi:glucuronate isomerase